MNEGYTNIYVAPIHLNEVKAMLAGLNVDAVNEKAVAKESYMALSFNHNDGYSEKKFSKAVKALIKNIDDGFFRARHYDEYATEVFWLNANGKYKRYLHEVDSESANIVKAYRHWHSSMGDHWDGHFDKDDILVMADRYGSYDDNGKKLKSTIPNYAVDVSGESNFLDGNFRVPHASKKWDSNINVLQSYGNLIIARSKAVNEINELTYERSFTLLDVFDSAVIGFIWSWKQGATDAYLVIKWHGSLATRADIIINHDNATLDDVAILSVYHKYIKCNAILKHEWVIGAQEQIVYPPCIDYLWSDCENERITFGHENIVLNFDRMRLFKNANGGYSAQQSGRDICFEIHDEAFKKEIDALPDDKFMLADIMSSCDKKINEQPLIACNMQVQFATPDLVKRVLNIEVFYEESFKTLYKRESML